MQQVDQLLNAICKKQKAMLSFEGIPQAPIASALSLDSSLDDYPKTVIHEEIEEGQKWTVRNDGQNCFISQ